jgi:hypothetical protein
MICVTLGLANELCKILETIKCFKSCDELKAILIMAYHFRMMKLRL